MDVAGFIIGASSLISVVDKAFLIAQTVDEVRYFPKDMQQCLAQLANESHKIYLWSLEALLYKNTMLSDSALSTASELRSAVEQQMAHCVVEIESGLQKANSILKELGILEIQSLPTTDYNVTSGLATILQEMKIKPDPNVLKQLFEKRQTEIHLKRKVSLRKKILSVSKPWGVRTKKELEDVLSNVKYWNYEIWSLLSEQRQLAIRHERATRILASATDEMTLQIIETSAEDDVDIAKSAALARRKLDADKEEAGDDEFTIAFSRIQLESPQTNYGTLHDFAARSEDDGKALSCANVYVEWLDYSELQGDQLDIAKSRIKGLCKLLVAEKPHQLPTLKALGYVTDRFAKRFGILFEASPGDAPGPLFITLRQMISPRQDEQVYTRPTLAERFSLARQLAAAFLELHKARWLHKGFNSESILFRRLHDPSTGWTQQSSIDIHYFSISGFQYARPIGRDQVSLPISLNAVSDMTIYHHPSIRENFSSNDPTRPYVKYDARHDIYSLGLVLLEIGIWKSIKTFFRDEYSPEEFAKRMAGIAKANLPHSMGSKYAEIVLRCLDGPKMDNESTNGLDLESKVWFTTALEINWVLYEIVRPLEDCQCRSRFND